MLNRAWRLYYNLESEDLNDPTRHSDPFAAKSRNLTKKLARHVATCVTLFLDSTDVEGLAHLAGLLMLYFRVMNDRAMKIQKYFWLRKAFRGFEPGVIVTKWRQIENLFAWYRDSAIRLDPIDHDSLDDRIVAPLKPPKCVLHASDVPIRLEPVNSDTFVKFWERDIGCYELRTTEIARQPLNGSMRIYPTKSLTRVVSSNGICYDLPSRLDDHDSIGLVHYDSMETIANASTPRSSGKRYVEHFWYEAGVVSLVLLDGTRYSIVDNNIDSARSFARSKSGDIVVAVYRAPSNAKCNVRANENATLRNRSGFTMSSDLARKQFPTKSYFFTLDSDKNSKNDSTVRRFDEFQVSYKGADDDTHVVIVQTFLDDSDISSQGDTRTSAHEYIFDEYNTILLKVHPNRRVIVRVQHRRLDSSDIILSLAMTESGLQEIRGTSTIQVDRFFQNGWLEAGDFLRRTFLHSFDDFSHKCASDPFDTAVLYVESLPLIVRDYHMCAKRFASGAISTRYKRADIERDNEGDEERDEERGEEERDKVRRDDDWLDSGAE